MEKLFVLLGLLSVSLPGMMAGQSALANKCPPCTYAHGAIIRGDSTQPSVCLVFTGDAFADGGDHIRAVLKRSQVPAAFFFTGNFYRNPAFAALIRGLRDDGHYLGAHSDRHLLYCSWEERDSLLLSRTAFIEDLAANYREMERYGIEKQDAPFFLPPYEWYNETIAQWTTDFGLQLVNFTPGTRSNADYTTPAMVNYLDSETIYRSILEYEQKAPQGLNGFLLLIHIGTDPARTDKFYRKLEKLIRVLKEKEYVFSSLQGLLH